MEEVKANLERVEDIQREVIKNFEKAEEESARLKVYNGLKEELKEFDIALLMDGYGKLKRRAAKLEEREESARRGDGAAGEGRQAGHQREDAAKEEEISR